MEGFLNPSEVLKRLELKKNMIAADFGSGSGGWAIPLAKILEEGKVYAIDILEEPLSALRAKVKIEKLFNIETRKADLEKGTTLLSDSCDLVLMTNLLFECQDKKSVLKEGERVLKPGGKILVVDWKKDAPFGPKGREVLPEEIIKLAEEIGLELEKPAPPQTQGSGAGEFEAGSYHWGLILLK